MTQDDKAAAALADIHRLLESFIRVGSDDPDHRIGDAYSIACNALGRNWDPWHQTTHVYCLYCENPMLRADALYVAAAKIGPFCNVCKWHLANISFTGKPMSSADTIVAQHADGHV